MKILLVTVNVEETGDLAVFFREQLFDYLLGRALTKIAFAKEQVNLRGDPLGYFRENLWNVLASV